MTKVHWLLGALLAVLVAGCSSSPTHSRAAGKAAEDRKAAPEFALRDAKGSTVELSDYKGKVVLLNFWATWCVPCRIEIPWFIEFEKTYKDRGLAVLGISMDEDGRQALKRYVEENKVNYGVVLGDDHVAQLYGVDSLPTTFLIDKEGRIASVHIGLVSKSGYENEILHLLDSEHAQTVAPRNVGNLAMRKPRSMIAAFTPSGCNSLAISLHLGSRLPQGKMTRLTVSAPCRGPYSLAPAPGVASVDPPSPGRDWGVECWHIHTLSS
jgi:cytochrome c biogenesis protein CcmG/thiol:disulfide interchange protein DsbE